jgi:SAM-dependent methyltransferase
MRRLVEIVAGRALDWVGVSGQSRHDPPLPPNPDPPATTEPPRAETRDLTREFRPGPLGAEQSTVSMLLRSRLDQADVIDVEGRIARSAELQAHYASASTESLRGALILAYGLWLEAAAVSEKTGLVRDQPPDEVHAMARGPLAAAGGLYEADLVVDALTGTGVEMSEITQALDFGCSSGRVVRVLAAAYPGISWHAADPNGPAIAWATEMFPSIDFFVNEDAPPLPLADESLDLVYAISIWSHFAPELGLRWFDEMHRVIRPAGHLVITTHGLTAVSYYAVHEHRTPEQSIEIADALYRQGWWYAPEFGEEGDWGVVNPEWGTAFLSAEWLLAQLCPRWRVLEFAPGRNQDNQDVYVLQRV